MENAFTILDYIVFIGTLVVSLLIGSYYAFIKTQKTNEELLVGNRDVPIFSCCLSLVATYMSAILVLGYSGEIYNTGTIITEVIVGTFVFLPLGGLLFLPTLYRLKLTSAYEYLELRFKSPTVRFIATITFIVQIVLYMGVVLFAPAIALNAVIEIPIWASIVAVGGCAAIYTSIGGLRAVLITDVLQICIMLSGMMAIVVIGSINVGGLSKVYEIANDHGRIEFLNFTVDPFLRHSSFNIFFGQGCLWMSAYGCHQTTVQRYCSMGTLKKAFLTLILTVPLLAFTMSLAGLTGLVIFSNYAGCDPVTLGFIKRSDQISPYYVLDQLSETVGILGLFIACLFSGALSTISSAINSLAAVTWEDFCTKIRFFRGLTDQQQGYVTKCIGMMYGGIAIGMGFGAQNLGGVLSASIVVNGAVAGPLLGAFILGVIIPFANKKGVIVGMLSSHVVTFWISIGALLLDRKPAALPFSIDTCSNKTLSKVSELTLIMAKAKLNTTFISEEIEWPQKIYTISYMLYPLIGTIITVTVGSIVSLLTGPSSITIDQEKYLHPVIVKLNRMWRKESWKEDMELSNKKYQINGKSDESANYSNGNGVKVMNVYQNSAFTD